MLEHNGQEERVLFESGDFTRELESLPDVLRALYRGGGHAVDRLLSVKE